MTPGREPDPASIQPPPHRSMRWWLLLLLAVSVPLIGEVAGHGHFSTIGNALAHHAFHLATVVVAAAAFWALVVRDIRRNGVPPALQPFERLYRSLGS